MQMDEKDKKLITEIEEISKQLNTDDLEFTVCIMRKLLKTKND